MLIAAAAREDELRARAGQIRDETAPLEAEIVRMAAINERAEERIANLHMIFNQLERARFGRSSDRLDGDRQACSFDEVQTGPGLIAAERAAARPEGGRRRCEARPRTAFPAHLERLEIVIEPQTVAPVAAVPASWSGSARTYRSAST